MKILIPILFLFVCSVLEPYTTPAADFGRSESALSDFKAVRYESIYTKVPTSGKLVSIKITDSGKIYYICREKSGYVIYNLEVRPTEGIQERIQQELKKQARNWAHIKPDELVFTKEIFEREIKRQLSKDSEAVWVRNEIIIEEPAKPQSAGQ
ncbi:MAG TPA: hypothetical protein VMC85_13505 [Desulfomonilaceae bacterium]|nr:hypothetical protein [Desulfomonilaceae bacterium]